jgi:DNA-binding NtrC family response regulator
MDRFKILIIDDEKNVVSSLKRFLSRHDYEIDSASDGEKGLAILGNQSFDLLLLDLKMPGMDGMTVLRQALEIAPDLKIIIQTGHGGVADAVKALKIGATDFLEKSCDPAILRTRVEQVYTQWSLSRANAALAKNCLCSFNYPDLIGESSAMLKLKDMITRVAPTDSTILIQGESGTGKEIIARAIHHHSMRNDHDLVTVDCTTIGESVFESELFGHKKGSFTGANVSATGLVRTAEKGTLFLDEIGELSLNIQAKLLRVIQEKTIRPVGSTQNLLVDFRLIAATNKNLADEVAKGLFRQDLFYRLSFVTLTISPLREREGDIHRIANHLISSIQTPLGKPATITREAMLLLERYNWPGNVRELENILRGSAIFSENGQITPGNLPAHICNCSQQAAKHPDEVDTYTLAQHEMAAIKTALAQAKQNRRQAALLLQISEATLYRKIKLYNL